jgi:hypothetical protein
VTGDLYLAAIASKPSPTINGVTGLGLTWTPVVSQCAGRNQTGVAVWKAQGTPSGNGVVTATLANAQATAVIAVARYSGVTGTGNTASANTLGLSGACTGGVDTASYSFSETTGVANAVVFAAAAMRNKTRKRR